MARRAYLDLEEELAVVAETGLYESREAFLSDAVATFFAARPDLREAVACGLYEKGLFSLGGAVASTSGSLGTRQRDPRHLLELGEIRGGLADNAPAVQAFLDLLDGQPGPLNAVDIPAFLLSCKISGFLRVSASYGSATLKAVELDREAPPPSVNATSSR